MSNVTIQFWDKCNNDYEENLWLVLDCYGDIYDKDCSFNVNLKDRYEPHFYKDGERIA